MNRVLLGLVLVLAANSVSAGTTKGGHFACPTKASYDRVDKLLSAGDQEGAKKAMGSEGCYKPRPGMNVSVVTAGDEVSKLKAKLNLSGKIIEFWMANAGVTLPPVTGVPVRSQQFGEEWPLTVQDGRLDCVGNGAVVFLHDGDTYAINGVATSSRKYRAIDPIWLKQPGSSLRVSMAPLLKKGLTLCK